MSSSDLEQKEAGAPLPAPTEGGWGAPPANSNGWGGPPATTGTTPGDWGALASAPKAAPLASPMGVSGGDTPDYFPGDKLEIFGLNQNIAAALGYLLGVPAVLYIFLEPKAHRFLRFHAFQAVTVGVAWVVACIATYIPILLFNVTGLAFFLLPALLLVLSLPALGLFGFIATIKAFQGKAWKIPKLGLLAERMAAK